jgi:hypothetical protein
MNSFFATLVVACVLAMVAAECPSACSGHGTCGAYDACTCFRNWMSNDCSERICPFGLAHVDTPMGDLDASSGALTNGATTVVVNDAMYPAGTTEQFPSMKNSVGDVETNTAHYYRECSNKGICDRSSGECECFDGYDGSACQRASCPSSGNGECSGHGTCHTIQELAAYDNENVYRLWDEDITMGCKCDAGYTGPDCSARTCKYGADPQYYDDYANIRHANFTVQFYIMNDDALVYGNYSLIFTDVYGEDWQTDPIDIDANCAVIQDRLESLPNDVIPYGSVKCYKSEENLHITAETATTGTAGTGGALGLNSNSASHHAQEGTGSKDSSQYFPVFDDYLNADISAVHGETIFSSFNYSIVNKFILAFPGNPGEIAPLKVNRYLDGKRPTLFSTEKNYQSLGVHIYSNGFHGEETDYVNDECEGVLVGLASDQVLNTATSGPHASQAAGDEKYTHYLAIDTDIEFERLKKCLGDADGLAHTNIEVYDWDYGDFMNPHLIKLIDATQDKFTEYLRADGSSYKVLANTDTAMGGGWAGREGNSINGLGSWENFPMSKLCSRGQPWQHDNYMESASKFPLRTVNTAESDDSLFESSLIGGENYNRGTYGWCRAINPPGFFAIVYFDDCSAGGVSAKTGGYTVVSPFVEFADDTNMCSGGRAGFRLLNRPATDYSTNTRFHVYTTKGTLQQVSQHSGAYTQNYQERMLARLPADTPTGKMNPNFIHSLHSNVIHVTNTTWTGGQGQVDCETAPGGTYGNLDCINKGDKIFLVSLGDRSTSGCEDRTHTNIAGNSINNNCFYKSSANSMTANPLYLNMYTVKKIGLIPKNPNDADGRYNFDYGSGKNDNIHDMGYRQQITLDMGVNAQYMMNSASDTDASAEPDTKATIYKFYPPTLASTGSTGYNYVNECSNRGICDSESGICECFAGYTGANCGIVNSLAE